VVLIAGLGVSRAMVKVGPPLFCRGPRLRAALVTVVAQALVALGLDVSRVTMLLVEARVTVPPPE